MARRSCYDGRPCRHCGLRAVNRPRDLCTACYGRPEIRNATPLVENCSNRRGVGGGVCGGYEQAARPTGGQPGSAAKLRTLAARAARGESLWRADDGSDVDLS
jgi:hypothetical protein